jgi:hypothetical protein
LYEDPVILVGAIDKKSAYTRELFKKLRDIKKPKESKETPKVFLIFIIRTIKKKFN